MLRIDRYILREMVPPFLAGTLVFAAVILANTIIQSSEEIFQLHTPPGAVFAWLWHRVPFILVFALPVGAMLSANLTVIRLGRDNELVPLRLGGMSVRRLFRPFFWAGLAGSLLSLAVSEFIVPQSLARANEVLAKVILQSPDQVVKANKTFRTGGEAFCHVQRVDMRAAQMDFVLIYRYTSGVPREALLAARARRVGQRWQLESGQHSWFDDRGRLERTEPFATYPVEFADNLVSLWDEDKSPEQLTVRQARARLALMRAAGESRAAVELRYFLHAKLALPLTCLIFTMLAAPLSMRFARPQTSPMMGVLLTIIVVFFANGTINWAKVLALAGSNAWLSPEAGAWLHVVVFGALAAGLIARAEG
ncbi:MAG: LptF/LptG family permease [Armatimonadetes bacterium]|nr:LptF/LptG family permease [Armatimonadota bacterium]